MFRQYNFILLQYYDNITTCHFIITTIFLCTAVLAFHDGHCFYVYPMKLQSPQWIVSHNLATGIGPRHAAMISQMVHLVVCDRQISGDSKHSPTCTDSKYRQIIAHVRT